MRSFRLASGAVEYRSKVDPTNAGERVLISPSQNVLINDLEKVKTRGGYSITGASSSASTPIISSFDWLTSTASPDHERNLRFYNGILEWYDVLPVTPVWRTLLTGLSTTKPISFTTRWNSTTLQDDLLFVNNSSTLYEWSGGVATFLSATSNTITKEGSDTWRVKRFFNSGTRSVRILDSGGTWREFAYTGGETTTTLTGVTPDPTAFTFSTGAVSVQSVRSNANTPASGYTADFIGTLQNHVVIGSETSRLIYVSSNTSFTSYTFSSPRVSGEGANLILDDNAVGLAPFENEMFLFTRDSIFKTQFTDITVGSTLVQLLIVKKVKSSPNQGARHFDLIGKWQDAAVYLSPDNILRRLIRGDTGSDEPRIEYLSDPVKPDFDAEDWSNGHIFANSNRLYISAPTNGNVYILEERLNELNAAFRFWQPPQTFPVRTFGVISGNLTGHSSGAPESYRLFDGTNDNGNAFKATARYAYQSFGVRNALKTLDQYYAEGYISTNTELILILDYDYNGATQSVEKVISGQLTRILFEGISSAALGDNPLGDMPLGDTLSAEGLPKFRIISEYAPTLFHELSAVFQTDAVDAQWEIIAHGPAMYVSPIEPISITI